jgi:hypothetical protein
MAFEGYIRQLRADEARPVDDRLARFREAMEWANSARLKRRVLAGLGDIADVRVLDVLAPCLKDPELQQEAAVAAEKVQKRFYVLAASDGGEDAKLAIDGKIETRWSTKTVQRPGQWFQIDLARETGVRGIVLDASRSPGDSPLGYEVYAYSDPAMPGEAVAKGEGKDAVLDIAFSPKKARYLKVVLTGSSDAHWWSIHELQIVRE